MASCAVVLGIIVCTIMILIASKSSHTANAGKFLEKRRIIIDTDAGTDDAVAILAVLGDPLIGPFVQAVTCVRGNTEVEKVSKNVLKILKIAGRLDIPVYVGSRKGYLESPDPGFYFGQDGMGDADYPEQPPLSILQKIPAAQFLATYVDDYPGEVSLLSLGPLTNIAMATRLNHKFITQIKEFYGLIGSVGGGSMRPNVEFNAYMDPHSAAIVLQELSEANRRMVVIPTDTIRENLIDLDWRIHKLGSIDNDKIKFINKIERNELVKKNDEGSWYTFDIYAATMMFREESIMDRQVYFCEFETEGRLAKAMMIVDKNNILNMTANVDIVTKIDKLLVQNFCLDNLS